MILVRSLLKSFAVFSFVLLALTGLGNAAESETAKAELVAEIATRDSVMALRDSACTVEKQSLRSDLEVERAKCENWEQSYNTLKKNNESCAKALNVAIQAGLEQAEKDKARQNAAKEKEQSDGMMRSASMLGSFGLGMLIMWLILD